MFTWSLLYYFRIWRERRWEFYAYDTMDDYSKELLETMYEYNNKSYFNLDIHEEIDVYYHHDQ